MVFELNSGFHLALVRGSGNGFLSDAAARLTRLRRLAGYVVALDMSRLNSQAFRPPDHGAAGRRSGVTAAGAAHGLIHLAGAHRGLCPSD